jgi:Ca2+-binding RTX toxin-like protein
MRTRDAKFFANPDGSITARFGHDFHYRTDSGEWADLDLTLRQEGDGYVLDRSNVVVQVTSDGLDVIDRETDKGIRWAIPQQHSVDESEVRFTKGLLDWTYAMRPDGVKLASMVQSPLGERRFTFNYQLLGGATQLSIGSNGEVISDAFVVPRAVAYGADGGIYPASHWDLGSDNSMSFEFDDSLLPPSAFPYELDPTTQFGIPNSADDGMIDKNGTTYPPTANTGIFPNTSGSRLERSYGNISPGYYYTRVGFARWDTSPLPNNATLTSAAVSGIGNGSSVDSRSLTADWYNWGTNLTASDFSETAQTTALAGKSLSSISPNYETLPLDNVSGINKSSKTGLRFHISGGQPTGANNVFMGQNGGAGGGTNLLVTYTAPTITSVSDGPDPVMVGDVITFTVGWSFPSGNVSAVICKTDDPPTDNPCPVGVWAQGAWSSTSPSTASYKTTPGDVGTHTYYARACNPGVEFGVNNCSSSLSGTFEVSATAVSDERVFDPAPTDPGDVVMESVPELPDADSSECVRIEGTDLPDVLTAGDGCQILVGFKGADDLISGNGHDALYGNEDEDHVYAGNGPDSVYGNEGADNLQGDDGADIIYGGVQDDLIRGFNGEDQLFGEYGADDLIGFQRDDVIWGGPGDDLSVGGGGNDTLWDTDSGPGVERDVMCGGAGNDNMSVKDDDFEDVAYGGDGQDNIYWDVYSPDPVFGSDRHSQSKTC